MGLPERHLSCTEPARAQPGPSPLDPDGIVGGFTVKDDEENQGGAVWTAGLRRWTMIAIPVEERTMPEETIAYVEAPSWPNDGRREALKGLLKDLEAEVLGRLRLLRAFPAESEPVKDTGEAALEDVTRDLEVALVERAFDTLKRIDEALARLDQGRYGICERCLSPISDQRLRALPFAALCPTCQRQDEVKTPVPSPRL